MTDEPTTAERVEALARELKENPTQTTAARVIELTVEVLAGLQLERNELRHRAEYAERRLAKAERGLEQALVESGKLRRKAEGCSCDDPQAWLRQGREKGWLEITDV